MEPRYGAMGVWADFKKFVNQGNFVTMAVAFVVGLAVSSVVTTTVSSVVNPLIGTAFHANFDSIGNVTVRGSTFTFGALLGAVINFLVVLSVIFFGLVYPMQKVQERRHPKPPAAPPPPTRNCPACYSTIDARATRCPQCTSEVTPVPPK